jgi:hypothetical protein
MLRERCPKWFFTVVTLNAQGNGVIGGWGGRHRFWVRYLV